MLNKIIVGSCLLVAAFSSGCAGQDDGTFDPEEIGAVSENLLALSHNLGIPDRHKNTVDVKVCWVMTQAEFDDYAEVRGWVREAITDSWQKEAWIRYSDWDRRCTDSDPARRLYLDPSLTVPGTTGGGAIKLDPDFVRPGLNNKESVMMTAVHEFGHALAFNHPQYRYDWTACPNGSVAKDVRGGAVVGTVAEDQWSIISYCMAERIATYRTTGKFMSRYDIRDARKFYGGDAEHVRHGASYALRNQNKKYLRTSSGNTMLIDKFANQDEARHLFRFMPAQGSSKQSGNVVQYGDFVNVVDPDTGRLLCAMGGTVIQALNANTAWTNTRCRWQIARTRSGAGGNNVDVNDPLRLQLAPVSGELGVFMTLENEDNWRLLGSF